MPGLTVSAQALNVPGGVSLAVEVRDGSGSDVVGLQKGAIKVWSVQGVAGVNPVKISIFWEVATSIAMPGKPKLSLPGIQELTGLYLLFLATPTDLGASLFKVAVTGPKAGGSCLATVANPLKN